MSSAGTELGSVGEVRELLTANLDVAGVRELLDHLDASGHPVVETYTATAAAIAASYEDLASTWDHLPARTIIGGDVPDLISRLAVIPQDELLRSFNLTLDGAWGFFHVQLNGASIGCMTVRSRPPPVAPQ